jgi:uncharacterized integral membrane protein
MSTGQHTPGSEGRHEPGAGTPPLGDVTPAGGTGSGGVPGASGGSGSAASYSNAPSYSDAAGTPGSLPPSSGAGKPAERKVTRAGMVWVAVVAALVLLILLIIFILQNQEQVLVKFLGLEGSVPLGMALFIASVTGGVLVAAAGGARILQLRATAHRARQRR